MASPNGPFWTRSLPGLRVWTYDWYPARPSFDGITLQPVYPGLPTHPCTQYNDQVVICCVACPRKNVLSLLLLVFMAVVDPGSNTALHTPVRLPRQSFVYLPHQVLCPDGSLTHCPRHCPTPVVFIWFWIRVDCLRLRLRHSVNSTHTYGLHMVTAGCSFGCF